jgi:peptide deformylase
MVLNILKYGEPILRKRCRPVKKIGDRERKLFKDMVETMHQAQGVGLAAPQVGADIQLIVSDDGNKLIKLANPKILRRKGRVKSEEGCLSVPDITVKVKRAKEVTVSGLNEQGKKVTLDARGLLAQIIQHECDHLKGKLIIDYLGLARKLLLRRKLRKK